MCGITGFCDFNKKTTNEILTSMTDSLLHRGPDDGGTKMWKESNYCIGFGQRRLAIIDVSAKGHQPMMFMHLTIVFNGEIYNFKEIRKELVDYGYSFNTESDTEVILKAFDKWGEKAVERFIGMFAFVIYDSKKDTLILFRDRVGVKPLFYYFNNGLFLFASEIKAFHQHPAFIKEIDLNSLALFLKFGYFPTPLSVFKHTSKLLPGHYLSLNFKTKNVTLNKYWDIIDFYNKPKIKYNANVAIDELEKLLISSCDYRMVSDVPVGVFLSGGFDSSLVTAILQKNRTEKLNTFTIGFREDGFDESQHASAIAQYLGTDHNEYFCTHKDAQEIFPQLPTIYDEPFGDSSGIPTTLVSRFAKNKVKVVNTGDGAEEVFAGYDNYLKVHLLNIYCQKIGKGLVYPINLAASCFPGKEFPYYSAQIKKLNNILRVKPKDNYHYKHPLLKQKTASAHTYFDDFYLLNKINDYSSQLLAIDFKTRLLDDFLVKIDRATMSTGLEAREPLLDHRIVEFMAQIPLELKCKGNTAKYLLKEVAYKYLPKKLLDRPKMGFSIPIDSWLRSELKDYLYYYSDESRLRNAGTFDINEVNKLKKLYISNKLDYNASLKFKLVLFYEMWRERWL
jgi:asparagine synthase (glutamine-hydrolysing)